MGPGPCPVRRPRGRSGGPGRFSLTSYVGHGRGFSADPPELPPPEAAPGPSGPRAEKAHKCKAVCLYRPPKLRSGGSFSLHFAPRAVYWTQGQLVLQAAVGAPDRCGVPGNDRPAAGKAAVIFTCPGPSGDALLPGGLFVCPKGPILPKRLRSPGALRIMIDVLLCPKNV